MNAIPLSEFGLATVAEAAVRRECDPSTVRRWVHTGLVPAVAIGSGRSAVYLVRLADVDSVEVRPVGAPVGNQNAAKSDSEKPLKSKRKHGILKKTRKP